MGSRQLRKQFVFSIPRWQWLLHKGVLIPFNLFLIIDNIVYMKMNHQSIKYGTALSFIHEVRTNIIMYIILIQFIF